MCDRVGVDTNIWEYAYVEETDVADADVLHSEARRFLEALLADTNRAIVLSQYQVIEILDVLRKAGASSRIRDALYDLFATAKCQVVPHEYPLIGEALTMSQASGIHIYDYIVALPLRGLVGTFYTADRHFDHPHFRAMFNVVNPLSWVMREGQRPMRKR